MKVDHERQQGASEPVDGQTTEPFLVHPRDILNDPTLSMEKKRSILAAWLSDIHAVPGAPRWRQLDNGGFVDTHDIWEALYQLDDTQVEYRKSERRDASYRRHKQLSRWIGGVVGRKRDDDDDDPPPCPIGIRLPRPPTTDWDTNQGAELEFAAA